MLSRWVRIKAEQSDVLHFDRVEGELFWVHAFGSMALQKMGIGFIQEVPMTFMEIVETVRGIYENADARNIYEHIAVQVDIVGEGSGSLYVEVAERSVCVEPYDYKDRDILVVTDGDTVNRIAHADISLEEAIKEGSFRVYGNKAKIELMKRIVV